MIPTVNVSCRMFDQNGAPIAGALVTARLTTVELYNGYVVPEEVSAVAGADGVATLALWPNELGVTASMYSFRLTNPDNEAVARVVATIPNRDCDLHLVANLPAYPGKTDGQLALEAGLVTIAAKVEVATAKADEAGASASAAAQVVLVAEGHKNAAEASKTAAANSASAALAYKNAAGDSATQAAASKNEAVSAANRAAASEANVASALTGNVKFDSVQALTNAQKAQARANIGVNSTDPTTSGTLTHTGNATISGSVSIQRAVISSGVSSWFDFRSSFATSSYGVFRRGADGTVAGYLGTDGGGISSAGTGTGFGLRSEEQLILGANQLSQKVTLDADGLLMRVAVPTGYGIGAGGTVTQPTSKSTPVTINKPSGAITTHPESLAAGASVQFRVDNNTVKRHDGIILTINNAAQGNNMRVKPWFVQDGYFWVDLKNESGAAQALAVDIEFQIFRGATA